MAKDYAPLAALATRLVTEFGRDAILTQGTSTPSDPSKPWLGSGSAPATVPCTAAFTDDVSYWKSDDRVRASDEMAILDANTLAGAVPQEGDKLDGREVIRVATIRPANLALAYLLAVRG